MITHNLGFPRIGKNRELKKSLEQFWQKKISKIDTIIASISEAGFVNDMVREGYFKNYIALTRAHYMDWDELVIDGQVPSMVPADSAVEFLRLLPLELKEYPNKNRTLSHNLQGFINEFIELKNAILNDTDVSVNVYEGKKNLEYILQLYKKI